jgi:hypothetical protein
LNAKANELASKLQEVLKPYLGSKVIKTTPYRQWTKKIAEALNEVTRSLKPLYPVCESGYRLSYNIFEYSVYVELDTTYRTAGEICHYLKVDFCLCSINGDHLSGIEPITERRTDYTVEEIAKKRAELLELEAQVSRLKSDLREFSR